MTGAVSVSPQVSVVLPLFGSHRAVQTLRAVSLAWLAQDVACEVVVGAAPETPVGALADLIRTGRLRVVRTEPGDQAPGRLRNLAVRSARAPVLYLSDGDVVPLGSNYLRRALEVREDAVFVQPWMYRLVDPGGYERVTWPSPGRGRICFVTDDGAGGLARLTGERFAWHGSLLMVQPPPEAGYEEDSPEMYWRSPYHWGGVLVDRSLFDEVGGYCPRYVGWGCEDDDLLVKLSGRARLLRGWRGARALSCLHFEHPRTYRGAGLDANRALLADRVASGAEQMIKEDLAAGADTVP
ncbi:galactosyltransferase-related protein [Rhizohabitans arisaemae]|uniref:galactosyltransferase-related protein n=1 Tax=Rhizohabitans arisaemae TaxID=2720610 RepID=UPI0024B0594C|nr:galactosyltransferase-related protein [Rhizohabitans arisaemae]